MVGPKALLDPDLSTRDKGKARSSRPLHKGGGGGDGGAVPPQKNFFGPWRRPRRTRAGSRNKDMFVKER